MPCYDRIYLPTVQFSRVFHSACSCAQTEGVLAAHSVRNHDEHQAVFPVLCCCIGHKVD
jgi:hypothetical protein